MFGVKRTIFFFAPANCISFLPNRCGSSFRQWAVLSATLVPGVVAARGTLLVRRARLAAPVGRLPTKAARLPSFLDIQCAAGGLHATGKRRGSTLEQRRQPTSFSPRRCRIETGRFM